MRPEKRTITRLTPIAFVALILGILAVQIPAQSGHGGIKLLDGFVCTPEVIVDGAAGAIWKPGGLKIEFEEGLNQGVAVDVGKAWDFEWAKAQVINGQPVKLAFVKQGKQSVWEPDQPRNSEFGSILLVSFPLSKLPDHAINFRAEILSQAELVDALLMVLTYKSTSKDRCRSK